MFKKSHYFNHLPHYSSSYQSNSHYSIHGRWQSIVNGILILGLLLAYPLALVLPNSWGWENGPLEWFQAGILFTDIIIAFWYHYRNSDGLWSHFWFAQIPFWLILFSRETSWLAAFLPLKSFGPDGPTLIPLRELWYRPVVYPILVILSVITLYTVIKYKLYTIPWKLLRQKCISMFPFAIAIFAIVTASCFEKDLCPPFTSHHQLLEEYLETIFYLGLSVTGLTIYFRAKEQ